MALEGLDVILGGRLCCVGGRKGEDLLGLKEGERPSSREGVGRRR